MLPPNGIGSRPFVLSPDLAEKYRQLANCINVAAPSERLDAFTTTARYVAGLVHPENFPKAAAVDRLWTTAEAHGLVLAHGTAAVQERLVAGLADPIAPDEDNSGLADISDLALGQGRRNSAGRVICGNQTTNGSGNESELDLRLAFFARTDLGNAERFLERCRDRFLWGGEALGWLWWDSKRWSRAGAEDRIKMGEHEVVRAIQDEANALRRSGRDVHIGTKHRGKTGDEMIMMSDALAAWGRASESANRLAPISRRAAPYLAVSPEQLDADPFKLNVANGTIVISRNSVPGYITFRPHDPADLITKCSPVVHDPRANCPLFDEFLAYVQPKTEDRCFLLAWQGLSLTGDTSDQKLAVFWGKGKNGKSTFIDICAYIAGDYSETVPIETFLADGRGRNAGQATPDLAILPGVRHLRTSEPDKGCKLAEAMIKLVTGGEPILVRHLNRDYFKFYPQFKLTISGNYRPSISGADEGIWRRVQLVPWPIIVPEEKRDPELASKLRAEASGILNRLLDGLRGWMDHRLVAPESVREATADYRRDSDPLGRFLEACVAPDPDGRVQSSAIHELFCAWAKANGAAEWSNKGLTAALIERGLQRTKSGVMFWTGVKVTREVSDFANKDAKEAAADSANTGGASGDVVDL
jgi:putative DNA primase/helicase